LFSTAASLEKVRAKYPFDATSEKQLSLKVGDVVTVVEKSASGWFKGECNGAVGMFPSNYTEPIVVVASEDQVAKAKVEELKAKRISRLQAKNSASPELAASTIQRLVRRISHANRSDQSLSPAQDEKVRVLFGFKPNSSTQLALSVGDLVTILEKHASGWYKGECNGAVGLFPSNYTEPFDGVLQPNSSGVLLIASPNLH
jgi:hypothetical protein